jgi:hypothetical protein
MAYSGQARVRPGSAPHAVPPSVPPTSHAPPAAVPPVPSNAVDLGQMLPVYRDLGRLLRVSVMAYDYTGWGPRGRGPCWAWRA